MENVAANVNADETADVYDNATHANDFFILMGYFNTYKTFRLANNYYEGLNKARLNDTTANIALVKENTVDLVRKTKKVIRPNGTHDMNQMTFSTTTHQMQSILSFYTEENTTTFKTMVKIKNTIVFFSLTCPKIAINHHLTT